MPAPGVLDDSAFLVKDVRQGVGRAGRLIGLELDALPVVGVGSPGGRQRP